LTERDADFVETIKVIRRVHKTTSDQTAEWYGSYWQLFHWNEDEVG
jgi:hypothetical protein